MLVQGGEFGADAEMAKQGGAVARIFGGDNIYRFKGFQRAQGDVLQIANRRGNHI